MVRYLSIIVFLAASAAVTASADPMSVYGSADEPERNTGGIAIRAGAGSLYGPAFDAGQPVYAHSDGFDWENRRPFSTPHQLVSTYGLAASLTFGFGQWALGPTLIGGFNTTRSSSDDFSEIQLNDSMTGGTFGAGLHAARGAGPLRLTIDVVGSYSSLRGKLDWSYSDFFGSETLVGAGEWETSYVRVAALGGVEFELSPVFIFVNAGAQFLPEQQRGYRVSGSFPEAHTKDPFNVAIQSKVDNRGQSTVTFAGELSFAASAGLGLRF